METGIKENILAFNRGITNTPSDLVCDDDCLSVCEGLTNVEGEMKAVQKLGEMDVEVNGELMYVHYVQNATHYVYLSENGLYWINKTGSGSIDENITDVESVIAVGNTLIVNTSNGLLYYLWKADSNGEMTYISLGSRVPDIECEFGLTANWGYQQKFDDYVYDIIEEGQNAINDMFVGNYEKAKKELEEQQFFALPFFARMAVELYDGSFTNATAPVLLLPNMGNAVKNLFERHNDSVDPVYLYSIVKGAKLKYKMNTSFSDWADIVKNVVIFVTRGVELNDTNEDCSTANMEGGTVITKTLGNGVYTKEIADAPPSELKNTTLPVNGIPTRPIRDVVEELRNERVYYKLMSVGIKDTGTDWKNATFAKYILSTLEAQTQLVSGDYYSHCSLHAEGMTAFNRRLNIYGVERGFFDGFGQFGYYTTNDTHSYSSSRRYIILVDINTPSGVKVVKKDILTDEIFYENMWFYYPDPRATRVRVYYGASSPYTLIFENTLTEHPGLNGAFCLKGLPDGTEGDMTGTSVETLPGLNYSAEKIGNYVLQSDVDNPFTFNASGYVRVGQGEIIGISGLTTALSQDAYKVATTIAFTTQGIWALQIDSTGQYAQIAPPFSREVCVDASTITMTDDAVFFVSKKGLMCVTGTNEASVVCVSEQMQGKGFKDFFTALDNCKIAYDYRDSLLYVMETLSDRSLSTGEYWVFNIKNRTWSTVGANALCGNMKTVVGDYPDTIVQTSDNKCFSCLEKPLRDEDTENAVAYDGTFESRALKLDGSTVLKSLRQVKVLDSIDKSKMELHIYGSNDLSASAPWTEITSRRGKSWRFFKVKMVYTGITANDSFSGMILVTQERFTNKIR